MDWYHVSGQYARDEVMAFEDAQQLPIVDIQEEPIPPVQDMVAPVQDATQNADTEALI